MAPANDDSLCGLRESNIRLTFGLQKGQQQQQQPGRRKLVYIVRYTEIQTVYMPHGNNTKVIIKSCMRMNTIRTQVYAQMFKIFQFL